MLWNTQEQFMLIIDSFFVECVAKDTVKQEVVRVYINIKWSF